MNQKILIDRLIYGAVIIVSLIALALVAASQAQFASTKLVYQGF